MGKNDNPACGDPSEDASSAPSDAPWRPLRRLRQLAAEIEDGLARNDLDLICQAADLLAPALAEWQAVHAQLPVQPGESVSLAVETRDLLNRCETGLERAMRDVATEIQRLRRGQRQIAVRTQAVAPVRSRLDTSK